MNYKVKMEDSKTTEMLQERCDYRNSTSKENFSAKTAPPEGFMTGDEFERRVKEELKQLYQEHGLL
jgi:hypothetical protein